MKIRESARARFLSDALLANAEPWDGPVVRLRDLSPAELGALGLAPIETRRSEILTWRCLGAGGGASWHWTPEGSHAAGTCLLCFTSIPVARQCA
jgi:hypothetical protein